MLQWFPQNYIVKTFFSQLNYYIIIATINVFSVKVHEQLHTEEHTGRGQYHWLNLAETHWLTVDAVGQMQSAIVTISTSSSSESGPSQSTPP